MKSLRDEDEDLKNSGSQVPVEFDGYLFHDTVGASNQRLIVAIPSKWVQLCLRGGARLGDCSSGQS